MREDGVVEKKRTSGQEELSLNQSFPPESCILVIPECSVNVRIVLKPLQYVCARPFSYLDTPKNK